MDNIMYWKGGLKGIIKQNKIFIFELLTLGRTHGREYDGNVRGRMEK